MQRLFVDPRFTLGLEIIPTEAQAHYLANVMRLGPGAPVTLFNGQDGEWLARISTLRRGRATLILDRQLRPQTPSPDIWLVFAPLKRDATDLVVRQATEMGVSAILPVATVRTNTARINEDRLAAIAREAAEQCERLDLPEIRPLADLQSVLAGWPPHRTLAAALERGRPATLPTQAGALLIGPEGGFAAAELDALGRASFVASIYLGPMVLRAETAVVAGLALLQSRAWSSS